MAGVITNKTYRDGLGVTFTAREWSEDSGGAGPFLAMNVLSDGEGGRLIRFEDQASASADPGIVFFAKRSTTPANSSDTNGDYEPLQVNDGRLYTEAVVRDIGAGDYETVAASQSNQVLGASGAAGDYLGGLLIVPNNLNPGAVTITDGSNSPDIAITVFGGGTASVSNKVPFFVPLGIKSVTGGWRVTTGADVSVIASGNFT